MAFPGDLLILLSIDSFGVLAGCSDRRWIINIPALIYILDTPSTAPARPWVLLPPVV